MRIATCVCLIVCVFGLAGPPSGGLVAWAMMGARTMRSPLPFIAGAYGEGLHLALLTGIVCCIVAQISRSVGWFVPVLSALVVTMAWVTVGALLDPARPTLIRPILATATVFVPPSIFAAVVCWALTRRLLRHDRPE